MFETIKTSETIARIDLTVVWLLGFAILIAPLQWYQYHKLDLAQVVNERNELTAQWLNCVDQRHTMRMYFNNGVDWVEFKCVETDSNLYHFAPRRKGK